MLEKFFSIEYAGRSDLFEGLKIWEYPEFREMQGTFPVIPISFMSVDGNTFSIMKDQLISAIAKVYMQHSYLLEGDFLTDSEKRQFMSFYDYANDFSDKRYFPENAICESLSRLSEYLCRYHNKKVLIFLDEYDTPMQDSYVNGFRNELMFIMRSLFKINFRKLRDGMMVFSLER